MRKTLPFVSAIDFLSRIYTMYRGVRMETIRIISKTSLMHKYTDLELIVCLIS